MNSSRPPVLAIGIGVALAVTGGYWWMSRPTPTLRPMETSVPLLAQVAPPDRPPSQTTPAETLNTASVDDLRGLLQEKIASGASAAEIYALLQAIAATRADLAIDLAHALGRDESEQAVWVADLTREWTGREPRAAWQWLFRLPIQRLEKLSNGNLLNVVTDELAQKNEKLLLENADFLLLSGDKHAPIPPQALVHAGIEALLRHGKLDLARDTLDRWTRDPSRNDVGSGALSAVALGLAQKSRDDAGSWLKALPATDDRNSALSSFAADWVASDPSAALTWSATLRPEDGRTAVVSRAYSDWLEEDASKAGEWLGEKLSEATPPPDVEILVTNLVHQSALIRKDPAGALQWTEFISDPAVRTATQDQLLLRWGARDQLAFERHLTTDTTLSPEKKATLLQQVRNHHLAPEKSPLWFSADAFEK